MTKNSITRPVTATGYYIAALPPFRRRACWLAGVEAVEKKPSDQILIGSPKQTRSRAVGKNKELNRFSLLSKKKVQGQWQLYSLVHNIEKLANFGRMAA